MCGRYTLTSPGELRAALAELGLGSLALPELTPRFNIAPTQRAPVVVNRAEPAVELLRWGLVPHWAKELSIGSRMINARAESLADKPAFREAFARRRCLVPADGFFEWVTEARKKKPRWIRREPRQLFWLAGLWERWRSDAAADPVYTFTIVTTEPCPVVAAVHDRMPVIVEPADAARWLDPAPLPPEALVDILSPSRLADLVVVPVSTSVNSPFNDSPACVAPPEQPALL